MIHYPTQYEQLLQYSLGINSIWFNGLEACLRQANGRSPLHADSHVSSLSSFHIKSPLGSVSLGLLLICSHKTRTLATTMNRQRQPKGISLQNVTSFSTSSHPENTELRCKTERLKVLKSLCQKTPKPGWWMMFTGLFKFKFCCVGLQLKDRIFAVMSHRRKSDRWGAVLAQNDPWQLSVSINICVSVSVKRKHSIHLFNFLLLSKRVYVEYLSAHPSKSLICSWTFQEAPTSSQK